MFDSSTVFLVVLNFKPMRTVTVGQLHELGACHVLSAANASEALNLLKNEPVDIVLSDWNMPGMSGLDLLKTMRGDPQLSHLPFVMITGEADDMHARDAIDNGVTSLLIKPYTLSRLGTSIEKAFACRPRRYASRSLDARKWVEPVAVAPQAEIPSMAATATEDVQEKADHNARATILIVDDISDNLMLLASLFKDEYRVRVAQNGEKALAICHSETPPDLVLLDVMMPGMSGFEVIAKMREHPASEGIPVVFVTAMSTDVAHATGLELGAVDYVTKPLDPVALKLRVRNFMRYFTLHKQLQTKYDDMLEMAQLREDVEHITHHDLRGPLVGLVGMLQSLIEEGASMNPRQMEQLHVAEKAAMDVLNTVNLSSELMRIETGRFKLDPQPIKIGLLLSRILEGLKAAYSWKLLAVSVHTESSANNLADQALGDVNLCYSMLNSLLKNACEVAPDGGQVTVTLRNRDVLTIAIENTGTVPKALRPRFFDKFAASGKADELGLGAYSAKLLARAQNGDIALQVSDVLNRTTVTVTLPNH